MSGELLLRVFERVADPLGVLGRLRQFVLDMAVRGRLVPQIPGEEATSQPIQRFGTVMIPGERRKSVRSLDIPIDSLPFTVPPTWDWAPLISICEVTYGFAFDSALFGPPGTGRPLVRIRDISSTDTAAYFSGPFDAHYLIRPGDYLVGMDGQFNVRRWKGPEALLNQRVLRMSSWKPGISPEWVTMPLQSILDHLHESTSQTTVKHLSAKQVNGIRIPLPPPAEQRRIVAKVDQLMALCDRLEAAQTEREARRDELRTASLYRLTASEGEAKSGFADARFFLDTSPRLITKPEHVAAAREMILDLAVRGGLGKPDLGDAPASVERWRPLREVLDLITDGDHATPARIDSSLDAVPLVTAKNVRDGIMDFSVTDWVAKSTAMKSWQRCEPRAGDILMVCVGATIGRLCVLHDAKAMVLVRSVALLRPGKKLLPEFLGQCLRSPTLQSQIWRRVKATGQPCLYLGRIQELTVPVPELLEQDRIVRKVGQLMAVCDELQTALVSAQDGRVRLLDALLHDALEGGAFTKLVGTGAAGLTRP